MKSSVSPDSVLGPLNWVKDIQSINPSVIKTHITPVSLFPFQVAKEKTRIGTFPHCLFCQSMDGYLAEGSSAFFN